MARVEVHVGRDICVFANKPVMVSGWMVIAVNGVLVENVDPMIRFKDTWVEMPDYPQVGKFKLQFVQKMKVGLHRP